MAFEIASTNPVVELGVILALLMSWQFTAAEFVGGPIMMVVLAVLFRLSLRDKLLRAAREQAEQGLAARWRAMPRWTCPYRRRERSPGACSPARDSPRWRASSPALPSTRTRTSLSWGSAMAKLA
nr:permease [Streptomyces sp. NBC_00830]